MSRARSKVGLSVKDLSIANNPKIRREYHLISKDWSSPESNLRMAEHFQITTFKRNQLFIWFWDFEVVLRRERRRFTPLQRRSSISERRPSLLFSSITRLMVMERLNDWGENVHLQIVVLVSLWHLCITDNTVVDVIWHMSLMKANRSCHQFRDGRMWWEMSAFDQGYHKTHSRSWIKSIIQTRIDTILQTLINRYLSPTNSSPCLNCFHFRYLKSQTKTHHLSCCWWLIVFVSRLMNPNNCLNQIHSHC